jgi:Protein of unknown function (DUF3775)
MSRKTAPGLPDVDVVLEVIRLADDLAAAERRWKPTGPLTESWLPERNALFDQLSRLPDERMTELHALYWLGQSSSTAKGYASLYQYALRNLDHGASYLSAKPLADGLRRGLETLGVAPDRIRPRTDDNLRPVAHLEN